MYYLTDLAFDNEGNPLALAIVWQCNRSVGIVNRLTEDDKKYVYNATGLNASPYFPASKMTWLIENELNITNTIHLSTVDSYLIYKLTNGKVFATDYSNASRTQLFNIKTLSWDEKLCKMFNVDIKYLPTVLNSNDSFGETTFEGLFKNPMEFIMSIKILLSKRLADLYDVIDEIENNIKDIDLKLKGINKSTKSIEGIMEILNNFELLFDQMTDEERRNLITLIIKEIHFNENNQIGKIIFKFNIHQEECILPPFWNFCYLPK